MQTIEVENYDKLKKAKEIMVEILEKVDQICRKHDIDYFIDWGTLLGAVRHGGFIPWDDDIDISMPREGYEKFKKIAQEELGKEYFLQTPETDEHYKYYCVPMKVRHNNSKYVEIVETGDEKFNQGIYIDIFPLDFYPTNSVNRKVQGVYKFLNERCRLVDMPFREFSTQRKVVYPLVYLLFNVCSFKTRERMLNNFNNKGSKDYDTYWMGPELLDSHVYKRDEIYPLKDIEFEGKVFKGPNKPHEILKSMYGDYMKLPKEEDRFSHSSKIEIYKV